MPFIQTTVCYLLNFNPLTVDSTKLLAFLDSRPEVRNWLTLHLGQVFIVSSLPVNLLTQALQPHFNGQLFLLTRIDGLTTNGWLPKHVWEFINNPTSSGRWDIATNPFLWKGLEKPPGT